MITASAWWQNPATEVQALAAADIESREVSGIEAMVCADIARRQQAGIAKYGTTVADNPLKVREWVRHAYEESLDFCVYLKRLEQML